MNASDVYEEFHERLRSFVQSRVFDRNAVQDILQDIFLKIHRGIASLQNESRVEAWIFHIARNTITDYYRSRKPQVQLVEQIEVRDQPPEQRASERLLPALHQFIEQLPANYRDAIRFTELEGLSQVELARRLGISLSGAKSRVQRGRAMLKEMLTQCCHFEFDRYGTLLDYHEIGSVRNRDARSRKNH